MRLLPWITAAALALLPFPVGAAAAHAAEASFLVADLHPEEEIGNGLGSFPYDRARLSGLVSPVLFFSSSGGA